MRLLLLHGGPGLGNIAPAQADYNQIVHGGGHGDYNAIVLAPDGNLVLLEIKAGPVEVGPGGIRKRYGDHDKNVQAQLAVQFSALSQRLKQAGLNAYMAQLLILPDQAVAGGCI